MKIYLIYDDFDDDYVMIHKEGTFHEQEKACFDSRDKAVTFIKGYLSRCTHIKSKGNTFTCYDPDDDLEKKVFIEEINVH